MFTFQPYNGRRIDQRLIGLMANSFHCFGGFELRFPGPQGKGRRKFSTGKEEHTGDGRNPIYPFVYRVSYLSGGCLGFLNHQHYQGKAKIQNKLWLQISQIFSIKHLKYFRDNPTYPMGKKNITPITFWAKVRATSSTMVQISQLALRFFCRFRLWADPSLSPAN